MENSGDQEYEGFEGPGEVEGMEFISGDRPGYLPEHLTDLRRIRQSEAGEMVTTTTTLINRIEDVLGHDARLCRNAWMRKLWHVGEAPPAPSERSGPGGSGALRFALIGLEHPRLHCAACSCPETHGKGITVCMPIAFLDETDAENFLAYRGKKAARAEYWALGWLPKAEFWDFITRTHTQPQVYLFGDDMKGGICDREDDL
jgi:hypothetical protein